MRKGHNHIAHLNQTSHPELDSGSPLSYTNLLNRICMLGVTFLIFILVTNTSFAQNIVQAEYFINTDLGVGANTQISITNGTIIDENFSAATELLTPGSYTIHIRTKDDNGAWSFTETRSFIIKDNVAVISPPPPAEINKVEYFIDTDPGYGLGTDLPVTQGLLVDIPSTSFNTTSLSAGFHTVGIRARNTNGDWGFYEYRQIIVKSNIGSVIPTVYDVTEIEYFFDDDPGVGLASKWPAFTQNSSIDLMEALPEASLLSPGQHVLVTRAKNTNGDWGMYERRQIIIKESIAASPTTPPITKMEYFFDGNDPGVGNAVELVVAANTLIDLNTVVPTAPTLIDGEHTITMRAMDQNGVWSMAEIDTFTVLDDCTQPIAAFTPSLACAGQTVTFVDNSTSIQPDATYRWYLNGDAIIDDTTVGNASFTYTQPGDYVVALAILQGTICYDSIGTTITIKPLPAVVFSATGTSTNQLTAFEASTVNLDPSATWSWDFDSDGTEDSTNPNTASYTYTADGSYIASLTVSDGFGCDVTTTKPITMSTGGGTGAPPSVDFLPENGCVGNTISFIDLSQNLPAGATYSWDFDGDGTEDSATPGAQNFTYSTAGSYIAKLIIDLGSNNIEATQPIEIADIPIADFSAVDVCEGAIMSFTDLTTNAKPTAIYMWDFDNDGIIDSNAKTAVSYTYANAGSHIVSLTISNDYGCANTIIKQVNVIGLPTPDFEWDIVCTGETISFNDLSIGADPTATYSWDLDSDGTEDFSTTGDVTFSYLAKGIYNPSLTITNPAGCAVTMSKTIEIFDRPEVAIDINARCYGQVSQMIDLSQKVSPTSIYSWDFDNDSLEDDNTVGSTSHTYPSYNSYLVTLNIDNGGGCAASTEELVVFSDAATPDFIINKTCEGEEVVFTDKSTDLATGAIYSWDYNGDNIEDAATPGSTAHTFNVAGTYDATLTIDNGGQCLAYKTIALDVSPPPAVDLGPDLQLCSASTLTFDAGTGYTSYQWPDGSNLQTFIVDQIGSYTVRVQDAKGCINYDTISVELMGPPVPSFNHDIELSLEGIKVSFTNTSTNADTYQWSFGDETTDIEPEPSHIYSNFSFYETSIYTVCLTATNACEEAQFCEDIFVSPTQLLQEGGDEIQVYPNPASQIVYVEISQGLQTTSKLALVNAQGKTLWFSNTVFGRQEINISELNKGIYYLILEQDSGFLYKKLMKN